MFDKLLWMLLISQFAHGVTVNRTLVQECALNYTLCTNMTDNCSAVLDECLNASEIYGSKPQSCYQAEAAAYAFKVASWFAIGVFSAIITLSNAPLIVKYLSKRYQCCSCCLDDIEVVTKEPTANANIAPEHLATLLKLLTTNTATTLSTVLTGTITFVSTGWLFNLWQSLTNKDADCQYYLSIQ